MPKISLMSSLLPHVIPVLGTLKLYSYGNVEVLTSALILHSLFFYVLETSAMEEGCVVAQCLVFIYHLAAVQIFPEEGKKATH